MQKATSWQILPSWLCCCLDAAVQPAVTCNRSAARLCMPLYSRWGWEGLVMATGIGRGALYHTDPKMCLGQPPWTTLHSL